MHVMLVDAQVSDVLNKEPHIRISDYKRCNNVSYAFPRNSVYFNRKCSVYLALMMCGVVGKRVSQT